MSSSIPLISCQGLPPAPVNWRLDGKVRLLGQNMVEMYTCTVYLQRQQDIQDTVIEQIYVESLHISLI